MAKKEEPFILEEDFDMMRKVEYDALVEALGKEEADKLMAEDVTDEDIAFAESLLDGENE